MLERFEIFGKFIERLVDLLNLQFARQIKLTTLCKIGEMLLNLIIDIVKKLGKSIFLSRLINFIMEIRNLTKQVEKNGKIRMTGLLGMIWTINFWNMKCDNIGQDQSFRDQHTLAKNWMKPTIVFYKSFKTSPGFGKLLSLCWLIDTSHFYGTQFEKFVLTMGPAPLPLKLPTFFMGNFSLVCFIGQRAAQIISILWDSNKNLGIR